MFIMPKLNLHTLNVLNHYVTILNISNNLRTNLQYIWCISLIHVHVDVHLQNRIEAFIGPNTVACLLQIYWWKPLFFFAKFCLNLSPNWWGCKHSSRCTYIHLFVSYFVLHWTTQPACWLTSCYQHWRRDLSWTLAKLLAFSILFAYVNLSCVYLSAPFKCFPDWVQQDIVTQRFHSNAEKPKSLALLITLCKHVSLPSS